MTLSVSFSSKPASSPENYELWLSGPFRRSRTPRSFPCREDGGGPVSRRVNDPSTDNAGLLESACIRHVCDIIILTMKPSVTQNGAHGALFSDIEPGNLKGADSRESVTYAAEVTGARVR